MKLGIQSYSLRKLNYEKALETISKLGIGYVEAFPGHLMPNKNNIKSIIELHEKFNVKLIAHGVNGMKNNEKELRSLFEFAKSVGIEVLTADPDEDALGLVNDLAKEYEIKVGIHNHGPKHRWGSYKKIYEYVKNLNNNVGMCLDLAHLVRYGEDPIQAIDLLKNRIHDIHLKDVNDKGNDVIIGKGIINVKGVLSKAEELGLKIPIMIEYEPEDPLSGITESIHYLKGFLHNH